MSRRPETVRTIDLGYEQMFVFEAGPDSRVRVLYGATWLTEEGVPGDSIVRAGNEIALQGTGLAVVQGLEPARMQVVEFFRSGPAKRIANWLRQARRASGRMVEKLHIGGRAAAGHNA